MTLETQISSLATAVGVQAKALKTLINNNAVDLSALTTTAKTSLVAAINELNTKIMPPLTYISASGTNAIASVSPANAPAGQRHVVRNVLISYSGANPTNGLLTLTNGAGSHSVAVTAQGLGPFNPAFVGATAGTFTISLSAGGTSVVGRVVVGYSTEIV